MNKIGNLSIGKIPRVVGTVSRYVTLRTVPAAREPICDVVEVRLDKIGVHRKDWLDRCRAIEASGRPVLLTLRLDAEGGDWRGGDRARKAILEKACRALAAIDIEFASELCDSLCRLAKSKKKPIVVSFHDFKQTPSLVVLKRIVRAMQKHSNAIPKVATMIKGRADEATLRRLLAWSKPRPICVIGMGAAGVQTRIRFPALGSCLTYGYIDKSAAPGQWPAPDLVTKLRRIGNYGG